MYNCCYSPHLVNVLIGILYSSMEKGKCVERVFPADIIWNPLCYGEGTRRIPCIPVWLLRHYTGMDVCIYMLRYIFTFLTFLGL